MGLEPMQFPTVVLLKAVVAHHNPFNKPRMVDVGRIGDLPPVQGSTSSGHVISDANRAAAADAFADGAIDAFADAVDAFIAVADADDFAHAIDANGMLTLVDAVVDAGLSCCGCFELLSTTDHHRYMMLLVGCNHATCSSCAFKLWQCPKCNSN